MSNTKKADPRNVNVNFLPSTVTQKELREHFERCGLITSAKVVYSQYTGEHMGYGFVTFATEASAAKAIAEMHNSELHGKRIKVCPARGPNQSVLNVNTLSNDVNAASNDLQTVPMSFQSVTAIGNTRVETAPVPVMPNVNLAAIPVPQPQAPMPIASLPMAPLQQVSLHTMPQQLAGTMIQGVAPTGEPRQVTLIHTAPQCIPTFSPFNVQQMMPMPPTWALGPQPQFMLQPHLQFGPGAFSVTNEMAMMPAGMTLVYR